MKITIRADEGMWLTDGENFCRTADLGEGRGTDEFTEITENEYREIMKARECHMLDGEGVMTDG